MVEYEALGNGLCITSKLWVQWLYIHGDSKLIVNHMMGESSCCDSRMAAYRQEVRSPEEKFDSFKLHHILRWDNEAADAQARLESSHKPHHPSVFA
jgi:ribonuclease HI